MPRYIDVEYMPHGKFWDDCTDMEKAKILGWILSQPTANVSEVRNGEWIYHECVSSYDGALSGYSCSECNAFVDEELFHSAEFHKNFCGHCGAEMDNTSYKN